jgi:hypothetical protein
MQYAGAPEPDPLKVRQQANIWQLCVRLCNTQEQGSATSSRLMWYEPRKAAELTEAG